MELEEAAVLVLLSPGGYVLLERKSCSQGSPWACDVALPGGRIRPGEDSIAAALREAWEEAWVNPAYVRILCLGPLHATSRGSIVVRPIIAVTRGPLCVKPNSSEVDTVFWASLETVAGARPARLRHPRDFEVMGVELEGGLIVWGLTLRILHWVYSSLERLIGLGRC